MENQIQKFEPANVRLEVVAQLEKMQSAKFVALPENYKESAFFAIDKLANLGEIEKVPAVGVTKALISMFGNKLDYQKNHCYFFVQNDKNSPSGKSLRFGWQYQGLIHVAKTQCDVHDVIPVLVHEGDTFEKHYEYGALIIENHVPTFEGTVIGAYCVVEFGDKRRLVKYYTKAELDKRRDKSQAKNGQFWSWEREMYEKTVINATLKRLIETSAGVDTSTLYDEPTEAPRQIEEAEIIPQGEPASQPVKVKI
jgi:recombinational DNA repair protein RecT